MLKRKLKKCKTCGEQKIIFSSGNCEYCSKLKSVRSIKKLSSTKKKLETVAALKKKARYWFQRWIRLRDLHTMCCYGSNKKLEDIKTYDACHYLKFELYPEAGFDEDNVHGGTKGENIRDNVIAYRIELIKRKGEEWVKTLEDKYCLDRSTTYKWDRKFLEDIIEEYKGRCKKIEEK